MNNGDGGSVKAITERLRLWAGHPVSGMALVEFGSESARREVIAQLKAMTQPIGELQFHGTSGAESDVREFVSRLKESKASVISISGLEAAFQMGVERERAIDVLNFLRESVANVNARQIWWVTHDTARLLRERAPDWLSWFTPKLSLTVHVEEAEEPRLETMRRSTVSLSRAREMVTVARDRLQNARAAGERTSMMWAVLACPALAELERTGASAEVQRTRDEFLELTYGDSRDAARMARMRQDLEELLQKGQYLAAASLAGSGTELLIDGATPEREAGICGYLGKAHFEADRYDIAETFWRRAVAALDNGQDSEVKVRAWNDLAAVLIAQGQYCEAEAATLRALHMSESALGSRHPQTLVALNNRAMLYERQGLNAESEALLVRVLRTDESVLGAEHPAVLASAVNLAAAYWRQGRYSDAESLLVRVLHTTERTLGPEHPDTLASMHNLAALYETQGRHGESEQLYKRALWAGVRLVGADHPDVLNSESSLAGTYWRQGRLGEAAQLLLRVLAARERLLGPEHPDTLTSLNNLALVYASQDRYDEAEQLYTRTLGALDRVLGEQHPDTLTAVSNLARLKAMQGKYDEAEALYAHAVSGFGARLGASDPRTKAAEENLRSLRNRVLERSMIK